MGGISLKIFIFLFISFGGSVLGYAQIPLQVKPQPGDGIAHLLKRYQVHDHYINKDSFYRINQLHKTDYLVLGKMYKMPVYVFKYDGKSIRSTIDDNNWDKAVRIQQYNDALTKSGAKSGNYREDKVLWVPFHEYYDQTSTEKPPFKPYAENYNIFGSDYKTVWVEDEQLKGHVYYLISGHGGPDPGAMCEKDGTWISEDEYAYDVTLRLARKLIAHSATVYMIIRDEDDGIRDVELLAMDKDEVCWKNRVIPLNQVLRLKQRSKVVNDLYNQTKGDPEIVSQKCISIHVDSRSQKEKIDVFFYHYPGSKEGKVMGEVMLSTIKAKYDEHQKGRGYQGVVKPRDLYVLRETIPTMVYIELGNITNPYDQQRILIPNNRQALANWLTLGIIEADK